jgi:glucosamine 6-phosphate synthetase-like amidotransferase/phosphosugar isomerase protein
MCGVFGFVATGQGRLNLDRLKRIAKVTESRGHDAFGFAWIDARGRLRCFKQMGRITDALGLLSMMGDARMLIGHCRWATHGDQRRNINNHPHPADGGWIVHNGTLPDYRDVIEERGLAPVTECDSEVLGLLIEQLDGTLAQRCSAAVRIASPRYDSERPLVMLGLWKPGRLVMIRRGNPLHFSQVREGTYLASLPDDLPGSPRSVKNGSLQRFTLGKKFHYQSLVGDVADGDVGDGTLKIWK